jgi:hypothetical protein
MSDEKLNKPVQRKVSSLLSTTKWHLLMIFFNLSFPQVNLTH